MGAGAIQQWQPPNIDVGVVDIAKLADWMDGQGLPDGKIAHVEEIGGGTQNVLLKFDRGGRDYVLRRPPKHLRPKSNEVLRREARLLAALADTDVLAPRLIAACTDETVLGAVFYLMEPIEGFNASTGLPDLHAGDSEIRHRMGIAAVGELAKLGAVDHEAVGLGDYGNPDGFLERQVPRWLAELDSYSSNAGYPGPDLPGIDAIADWLQRHRPTQWRPGILHGDFHLANLMFRNDGPGLAAIVDWEMSTIGDPLLDLGWLLATWPDGSVIDRLVGPLAAADGLARPDELVATYGAASDRDLGAIDWYTVLASFKLAIVLEGTHARAFAGKAPERTGDMLHAMAVHLIDRAKQLAT